MISDALRAAATDALAEALGEAVEIRATRPLTGGSINHAATLETRTQTFFIKWNEHPIPDQFEREAEGLQALADSGSELVIPRPICARRPQGDAPAFLITEHLAPGKPRPGFDDALGQGLAALHRASTQRFGFEHDNYCGATPQPNPWTDDWLTFYRDHRLGFQISLAAEHRGLSPRDHRLFDRLLERLDEHLDASDPPALIHGDLWSGNLHITARGAPALIDPAAYYGHREAELGMMRLFGGFSERVFHAYHAAWPLRSGWEQRLELYELYHVLNHYNLFGGHYGRQAASIAKRWV